MKFGRNVLLAKFGSERVNVIISQVNDHLD